MEKLIDQYDIFIFDIYGVLWNGKNFIEHSLEALEFIKSKNKPIFILSNSTKTKEYAIKRYRNKGLIQGKHYDEMVTSGEILRTLVNKNKIEFKNNKDPKKFYCFGKASYEIFKDSKYQNTENPEDADFMYVGTPQFSENEIKNFTDEQLKTLHKSILIDVDGGNLYDTEDKELFKEKLKFVLKNRIPVLNANPDLIATEVDKDTNLINYIVRYGTISAMAREFTDEIIEFGKPELPAYQFVFDLLVEKYNFAEVDLKKKNFLMVGDSMDTDILGAQNATKHLGFNVSGLLLKTGLSFARKESILEQCENFGMGEPTHILDNLSF